MEKTINQILQQATTAHKEGNFDEAEHLYLDILKIQPMHATTQNNLGVILKKSSRLKEAETSYKKAIESKPDYFEAHNNLGNVLKLLGRFDEAETSFKKAIELKVNYVEAYHNLGVLLKDLDRLEEAEKYFKKITEINPKIEKFWISYIEVLFKVNKFDEALVTSKKLIELKPEFEVAHYILGNTLLRLDRFEEAEKSYRKAINLKPDFAEAYCNLGALLYKFTRLVEAEVSYRKAIELKPDYADAHNNLGVTLKELGRSIDAETSYRKAIELKPDYADAHSNLNIAIRLNKLPKNILHAKKSEASSADSDLRLATNPFVLNRDVEPELIANLYKIKSLKLDKTNGPLFGNGITAADFQLFENDYAIIKTVEKDLINIMKQAVRSDVHIMESFFNVLNSGSGSTPHNHLTSFDKARGLINKKYSLQYYISAGDQNCNEPGVFKLKDPDEEILPSEGMITIIPAGRKHSAVYGGKTDRVMIGVNFYSI